MNTGMTPDMMIQRIHENMPLRLKNHPYLQEFYGTIDWSVRGIFHSYLGWFSGDAADLFPLTKAKSGKYMLEMMDGAHDKLLEIAQKHIDQNDGDRDSCQWGLDIASKIFYHFKSKRKTKENEAVVERAKRVRIDGLNCMASFMVSANGRNYYLTQAVEEEMEKEADIMPSKKRVDWAIQTIPVDQIMSMNTVRLKVEQMNEHWKNVKIWYVFGCFLLFIRLGIVCAIQLRSL